MGKSSGGSGDWLVLEELLERGDPSFVGRLRGFHDAEALASFARRWYADRRAASRRFLLEYLDGQLDAYRHEPLIKRLFKLAEAAGDDEVMARFLVLFDRSLRREQRRRSRSAYRRVGSQSEAQALIAAWERMGIDQVSSWPIGRGQEYQVRGIWTEPSVAMPQGTTIPRDPPTNRRDPRTGWTIYAREHLRDQWFRQKVAGSPLSDRARRQVDRMRLFSVATRQYLRRRAWRYFRKIGRTDPGRYLKGASLALARYEDRDAPDGLGLIDNWGLVHILFHRSPVLVGRPSGWRVADARSLAELEPAPIYESAWAASPRAIVDALLSARCRPVRQWALGMIRRHEQALAAITVDELLGLLVGDDPDAAAFAVERLGTARGVGSIPVGRWLELIEGANPTALEGLIGLMRRHIDPRLLGLDQVVRLAASRPLPVARLGLDWLAGRRPRDESERGALLGLADAECAPLRPEIIRLVRERLAESSAFEPAWVLELADSRHEDVRAEGIAWFRAEPLARGSVDLWRRLIESPYDDVRFALVAELEARAAAPRAPHPGPESLRWLWASVLLNVHRGGRAKPQVVRQLVESIERRPGDLGLLLPLLAVALRSSRGPERAAGLAAVARLAEHRDGAALAIESAFPELKWR